MICKEQPAYPTEGRVVPILLLKIILVVFGRSLRAVVFRGRIALFKQTVLNIVLILPVLRVLLVLLVLLVFVLLIIFRHCNSLHSVAGDSGLIANETLLRTFSTSKTTAADSCRFVAKQSFLNGCLPHSNSSALQTYYLTMDHFYARFWEKIYGKFAKRIFKKNANTFKR